MMKYSTYLLLIGAAQACINDDITTKSAANTAELSTMADLVALKTADVVAFATELQAAQDHVNEMIADEKLAKVGKVQEEMTAAASNREAAELLLSQLLAADGNAAKNKILVDIANQDEKVQEAEKAYKRALNSCIPADLQAWVDEQVVAKKTEKDYDNLSADDKAKVDKMIEEMIENKTEKMADVKDAADYDEMDDANKAMFDKLLLAQWKVQKEEMESMDKKINMGEKTQAEWDAMTPEEQEAAKEKMKDMREMMMKKQEDRGMGEFQMRKEGDYFKMDKDQQALFDEKLGEKRDRMSDQMKGMVTQFQNGKKEMGEMTEDQRKQFMGDAMDMMKMKGSRDQEFENHDFKQRIEMGFFDKMSSTERANYDEKDKKLRDNRNQCQGGMDEKMLQMKKEGGFDGMKDEDKKNFQGMFMFQMGSNVEQMKKDREEDDDMRKRMGYFKQDQTGRDKIDSQVEFMQGKRTQQRMPVMQGESKSVCYPSFYHDGDNYRGGKDGEMHDEDMMEGMMKEGMKDMEGKEDMDGMMKQGMKGMGGMMDKMNGMEGMIDKMGQMDTKDKEEMMEKLKNMKNGDMQGMMKGGMEGMKDGVQQMMKEGMHGMMNMGDKQDLMSKMGGKEGVMDMMCMTGGKDKDGNDMKKKFGEMMTKKQGQSSGPPTQEMMEEKMKGGNGGKGMQSFNGGCAETLCCGHILDYGVWKEDYFCYDQWSQTIEDGHRFKCVEGMAKNLAAATLSIAAAVFMMQ